MKFESSDALREYSLNLSSQLKDEGFIKQSKILEHRATLACTTGWEWLGELGLGIEKIISLGSISNEAKEKLETILKTTKSSTPYG